MTTKQQMTFNFLDFHFNKLERNGYLYLKNSFIDLIKITKLKVYYKIEIIHSGGISGLIINIYNYIMHSSTGKFKKDKILNMLVFDFRFNFFDTSIYSNFTPTIDTRNKEPNFINNLYLLKKNFCLSSLKRSYIKYRPREQPQQNNII